MTATTSLDAQLSSYFAAEPDEIAWPYPLFERMQQEEPHGIVDWRSGPALIFTKHADVRAVMAGELPIANDGYRYGTLSEGVLSRLPHEHHEIFFKVFDFETLYMSRHDGERHQRLRRFAARAFTARRVAALKETVQDHVDELVDGFARSPAPDWKADVADRLPVRVIADLLGVPQEERGRLWEFAETIAAHFSVDEHTLRAADEALDDFKGFVNDLITDVRSTGQGTPLAKAMIEGVDSGAMSHDELVAMYLLVLFGGSETTTNLLGNGFLALQRHRDQWDRLVQEPARVRGAIEELLRYDAPLQYLPRVATEDFELHGRHIPEGQTVIIHLAAADRDPDVFPQPDRLDIDRPNLNHHLAFAFGPHFCLGAALARMEGELAFSALIERFPDVRLAVDEVPHRGSAMLRAVASLPVELGVDRAAR